MADLADKVVVIYFSDCWWCSDTFCPHHRGIQGEWVNSRVWKYFSAFIVHIFDKSDPVLLYKMVQPAVGSDRGGFDLGVLGRGMGGFCVFPAASTLL